jgi:hypothetical protein
MINWTSTTILRKLQKNPLLPPSANVLYTRARIHLELSLAFAQQVLNCSKVFLVEADTFLEFASGVVNNTLEPAFTTYELNNI